MPHPEEVYRLAASVLVFRRMPDGGTEFLLLHKPRKNDAWQLPQGGVEAGETLTQAAMRELREEASIDGCALLGESATFYQYDFPQSFRDFRPDNVRGQKIGFVFALAPEGAVVTVDGKEVDNHVWIGLPRLGDYIRRAEYRRLVEQLYAEALPLLEKHPL